MKGAIAAFVKTPGLSPIKTRLATDIGREKAEELFLQFTGITYKAMSESAYALGNTLIPYWAVGEKEGLNSPHWRNSKRIYTGDGDLADRMSNVYSSLLEKYDYVILIGSDSPDLSAEHILKAVEIIENDKFVFGPAYDGGFYLFGGQQPIKKEIWQSVEYSRNDTLAELSRKLAGINDIEYLEKLADIDTVEDLEFTKTPLYKMP